MVRRRSILDIPRPPKPLRVHIHRLVATEAGVTPVPKAQHGWFEALIWGLYPGGQEPVAVRCPTRLGAENRARYHIKRRGFSGYLDTRWEGELE